VKGLACRVYSLISGSGSLCDVSTFWLDMRGLLDVPKLVEPFVHGAEHILDLKYLQDVIAS
jgi:hypothetical protein